MSFISKLSYLRISARKVRLIADLIRGKSVQEAQTILKFVVKKSKDPVLKLLNQSVSNAKNNFQLEEDNLFISKIIVDEGPKLKRWRPRARGQTYQIQKKTSHIIIYLDQIVKKSEKRIKKDKKDIKIVKEKEKNISLQEKKLKLRPEKEEIMPKTERGIGMKKIFKRKAF